jgi:RimJ/RimL family protein N-acetyltransferase
VNRQPVLVGELVEARPLRNADLKRVMLEHAFHAVGTVVSLVGEENLRSRRAVEKLGAVQAGRRRGLVLYDLRR